MERILRMTSNIQILFLHCENPLTSRDTKVGEVAILGRKLLRVKYTQKLQTVTLYLFHITSSEPLKGQAVDKLNTCSLNVDGCA